MGRDSNPRWAQAQSSFQDCGPGLENKGFSERFAKRLPQNGAEPETGPESPPAAPIGDPDLTRVVEAWPGLPEHVRAAILTLAESADKRTLNDS